MEYKYKLIKAGLIEILEKKVNNMLYAGWQLYGFPFFAENHWVQGLYKPDPTPNQIFTGAKALDA